MEPEAEVVCDFVCVLLSVFCGNSGLTRLRLLGPPGPPVLHPKY